MFVCFLCFDGKTSAFTALSVKLTLLYCFVRIFCQLRIKHSFPLLPFILQSRQSRIYMNCLLVLPLPPLPLFSFLSVLSSSLLIFISPLLCLYFSTSTLPFAPHIYTHSFAVLSPCQKRSLTTDNSLPFLLLNPYTTFRYCLACQVPRNLTLLILSS